MRPEDLRRDVARDEDGTGDLIERQYVQERRVEQQIQSRRNRDPEQKHARQRAPRIHYFLGDFRGVGVAVVGPDHRLKCDPVGASGSVPCQPAPLPVANAITTMPPSPRTLAPVEMF